MDFSKYPLDKLLYFIAGILPGSVALWIYQLAVPGCFNRFFFSPFLGYRTKLGLATFAAFVIGNTITQFLASLLGAVGGAVGGFIAKPPQALEFAPWRDPTWRTVLTSVLGNAAPKDTQLMAKWFYDYRLQEIGEIPEGERALAKIRLDSEKLSAERDDSDWARWYHHYHHLLLQLLEGDVALHVQRNLRFNLEAASVYVLISATFVPAIRHWWAIGPSCFWVFLLIVTEWTEARTMVDEYSSFSRQITYLTGLARSSGFIEKDVTK
jgi:hypothetical protein